MLVAEEKSHAVRTVENIFCDLIDDAVKISVERSCWDAVGQIIDLQMHSVSIGRNWDQLKNCYPSCEPMIFEATIRIGPEKVINLAVRTLNQSSCLEWKEARALRISASTKPHQIKVQTKLSEDALAEKFIHPKPFKRNAATRYGLKMEGIAIQTYHKMLVESDPSALFKVIECGLIVREPQPWLCASPDGILLRDGAVDRLIEVKCPFKCANKPIINEDGPSSCNYLCSVNGGVYLKISNVYYTQVQMQLYVTGLYLCDFIVHSSAQTVVITIHRDDLFLAKVVHKVEEFYFNVLYSKLVDNSKTTPVITDR